MQLKKDLLVHTALKPQGNKTEKDSFQILYDNEPVAIRKLLTVLNGIDIQRYYVLRDTPQGLLEYRAVHR